MKTGMFNYKEITCKLNNSCVSYFDLIVVKCTIFEILYCTLYVHVSIV